MAYSTMTTRSAGYVVPASEWNQLIANDEACAVASCAAKGDLFVGTGAKTGAKRAAGTDYWALNYLAANTDGMAKYPAFVPLKNNGYQTQANLNTEVDVCSLTLPANAMGTTNGLIYDIMLQFYNNRGGNTVYTMKFYFGAASIVSPTATIATGATLYGWWIRLCVTEAGATNAQVANYIGLNEGGSSYKGSYALTVDTTAQLTPHMSVTMDQASANAWWKVAHASITFVPTGALT